MRYLFFLSFLMVVIVKMNAGNDTTAAKKGQLGVVLAQSIGVGTLQSANPVDYSGNWWGYELNVFYELDGLQISTGVITNRFETNINRNNEAYFLASNYLSVPLRLRTDVLTLFEEHPKSSPLQLWVGLGGQASYLHNNDLTFSSALDEGNLLLPNTGWNYSFTTYLGVGVLLIEDKLAVNIGLRNINDISELGSDNRWQKMGNNQIFSLELGYYF